MSKVGLPGADVGMSTEDPTIAGLVKPHGYATAQFGKNHLGDNDEMLPSNHGFDEFYAGNVFTYTLYEATRPNDDTLSSSSLMLSPSLFCRRDSREVTTPRLSFAGSGATGFDSTVVGQDIDENGNAIAEVATNTQGGLSSDFKSPFSIAVGGAYRFGSAKLHITGEWFAAVDEFDLLPSEPFIGQSSGGDNRDRGNRALTDVFNIAVGFDNDFSDRLAVYGSFRTNRSAFDESSDVAVPIGDWDLYHVAGGATFTFGRSELP